MTSYLTDSYGYLVFSLGQTVDTVIMNPPFGTRKKGADLDFLCVALKVSNSKDADYKHVIGGILIYHVLHILLCQVASQAVYSLHKTSTRDVSYLYLKF